MLYFLTVFFPGFVSVNTATLEDILWVGNKSDIWWSTQKYEATGFTRESISVYQPVLSWETPLAQNGWNSFKSYDWIKSKFHQPHDWQLLVEQVHHFLHVTHNWWSLVSTREKFRLKCFQSSTLCFHIPILLKNYIIYIKVHPQLTKAEFFLPSPICSW